MESLVGKHLGNYELFEELGRGAMGVVYKAKSDHTFVRKTVALKVLSEGLAEDPKFEKRFWRECRIAAKVEHKNIVKFIESGAADGRPYIAMEYLEGDTLQERLRRTGKLQLREALDIAAQVASGLDALHSHGIVHRDVKPQNVMITPHGVKLLDFGIARSLDAETTAALTSKGNIVGTPAYMSPEQCANRAIDHRSDIFSLGVLLYQMLMGRLPWRSADPMGYVMQIIRDNPPTPTSIDPTIPPAIERIVQRALAKDPSERFPHAASMAMAIYEFLLRASVNPESNLRATGTSGPTVIMRRHRIANTLVAKGVLGGKRIWLGFLLGIITLILILTLKRLNGAGPAVEFHLPPGSDGAVAECSVALLDQQGQPVPADDFAVEISERGAVRVVFPDKDVYKVLIRCPFAVVDPVEVDLNEQRDAPVDLAAKPAGAIVLKPADPARVRRVKILNLSTGEDAVLEDFGEGEPRPSEFRYELPAGPYRVEVFDAQGALVLDEGRQRVEVLRLHVVRP